jgi:hypothetical protein
METMSLDYSLLSCHLPGLYAGWKKVVRGRRDGSEDRGPKNGPAIYFEICPWLMLSLELVALTDLEESWRVDKTVAGHAALPAVAKQV